MRLIKTGKYGFTCIGVPHSSAPIDHKLTHIGVTHIIWAVLYANPYECESNNLCNFVAKWGIRMWDPTYRLYYYRLTKDYLEISKRLTSILLLIFIPTPVITTGTLSTLFTSLHPHPIALPHSILTLALSFPLSSNRNSQASSKSNKK